MAKISISILIAILPVVGMGAVWHVPGDANTIQEAIGLAAPGDTVVVACGTYLESGLTLAVPITLRSETGEPECVTIDGQFNDTILACDWPEGVTTVEGITFTGGSGAPCGGVQMTGAAVVNFDRCVFFDNHGGGMIGGGRGGAVGCSEQSQASFRACRLEANTAYGGGGVYGEDQAEISLDACLLVDNASTWGGGVELRDDGVGVITGCTFYGNESWAWNGGGVTNWSSHTVQIDNTIIAFGPAGTAVEGEFVLTHCDFYGNAQGDWVGAIADQFGTDCNLAEDPLFCNVDEDDFSLDYLSPCAPRNNDCNAQIGAYGWACGGTPVPHDGRLAALELVGCYPNPFNPRITVSFFLGRDQDVTLSVYDLSGRHITRLIDGAIAAGAHDVVWNGRDTNGRAMPSGAYFFRIEAGGQMKQGRITLLR